jgi:hypothetical protein
MRCHSLLIGSALLLALASGAVDAQKKKLYRWTDEKGEVHYTDALPPEAAQAARDELNSQGLAVESIGRAATPEERARLQAEKARLAEEKRIADEQAKMDAVLLGSYPTEADLVKAYKERFDLLERSVESAQAGIGAQEKSLSELLAHAAGLEREGKPVPANVVQSIGRTREQVGGQREFLKKREAERKVLEAEYDSLLLRYRELAVKRAEELKARSAQR